MQHPRGSFNPCFFLAWIYLSGTAGVMEVFSPARDTLLPVQIRLPDSSSHCVYVDRDVLVLHSERCIVRLQAAGDGQLRQLTVVQGPEVSKWQNSQPVVDTVRGVVVFVQFGDCVQVDMETGEEVDRVR